jgi:hypothetical protein
LNNLIDMKDIEVNILWIKYSIVFQVCQIAAPTWPKHYNRGERVPTAAEQTTRLPYPHFDTTESGSNGGAAAPLVSAQGMGEQTLDDALETAGFVA